MVVCFQFAPDYPKSRALIELKSRHISDKLLDGLTRLCEEQADKYLGKPQVRRNMCDMVLAVVI